jgi:hypothetical protein
MRDKKNNYACSITLLHEKSRRMNSKHIDSVIYVIISCVMIDMHDTKSHV